MRNIHSSRARPRARACLIGALFALGAASSAHAANMLVNGGFETGTFSGWTQGGDTSFVFAACGYEHSEGNCAAALGSTDLGTLAQSVTLAIGTTYSFSFGLLGAGDSGSSFVASMNGIDLVSLTAPSTSGAFQAYSFSVTATSTANSVAFRFSDPIGFMWLDNVSVAPAVPEPTSALLLGLGITGLLARGFVRRRRT